LQDQVNCVSNKEPITFSPPFVPINVDEKIPQESKKAIYGEWNTKYVCIEGPSGDTKSIEDGSAPPWDIFTKFYDLTRNLLNFF